MRIENLIIGAGPAGLAMGGRFKNAGIAFTVVEQSDKIACYWHNHYDRLHLHTVKQFSSLPFRDFLPEDPTYISRAQLVEYLESYARDFEIYPIFNEKVLSIKRVDNTWEVRTTDKNIIADNVIIATGVNRIINRPQWQGQNLFQGEIIHSRLYKNPKPFKGKKVLVVGMGNTGAEVALDLAEKSVETHISVRGELSIIPRDVFGRPVQLTAKSLDKLPLGLGDWLGTQIRKLILGDLSKYGLKISKVHPATQLKKTGKTPVIDIGTVKAIKDGKIIVQNTIREVTADSVVFDNGSHQSYDAIILATGYHAQVEDFLTDTEGLLDARGLPKEKIGKSTRRGLYFLGFDNYKLGGILGLIKEDSALILDHIKDKKHLQLRNSTA